MFLFVERRAYLQADGLIGRLYLDDSISSLIECPVEQIGQRFVSSLHPWPPLTLHPSNQNHLVLCQFLYHDDEDDDDDYGDKHDDDNGENANCDIGNDGEDDGDVDEFEKK